MVSNLRLSKTVPAHKVTKNFRWIKRDFMLYKTYREARTRLGMRIKPFDKCMWCKTRFEDEDMMALASVEKSGNKALCQTCAAEAENC